MAKHVQQSTIDTENFCDVPYATKFSHFWVAATKSVWIVLLGLESCFSGRDENELISQAYYVDPLRKT